MNARERRVKLSAFCFSHTPLALAVWLALALPVFADRSVSGDIGDDTWAAGETILVPSALTVYGTLAIQPGVTVKAATDVEILIAGGGAIQAEGTDASPVLFTVSATTPTLSNYWRGLSFGPGSRAVVSHAIIECAHVGVYALDTSPTLESCAIRSIRGHDGPSGGPGDPAYGVLLDGSSSGAVRDCTISGIAGGSGGVAVGATGGAGGEAAAICWRGLSGALTIEGCSISSVTGGTGGQGGHDAGEAGWAHGIVCRPAYGELRVSGNTISQILGGNGNHGYNGSSGAPGTGICLNGGLYSAATKNNTITNILGGISGWGGTSWVYYPGHGMQFHGADGGSPFTSFGILVDGFANAIVEANTISNIAGAQGAQPVNGAKAAGIGVISSPATVLVQKNTISNVQGASGMSGHSLEAYDGMGSWSYGTWGGPGGNADGILVRDSSGSATLAANVIATLRAGSGGAGGSGWGWGSWGPASGGNGGQGGAVHGISMANVSARLPVRGNSVSDLLGGAGGAGGAAWSDPGANGLPGLAEGILLSAVSAAADVDGNAIHGFLDWPGGCGLAAENSLCVFRNNTIYDILGAKAGAWFSKSTGLVANNTFAQFQNGGVGILADTDSSVTCLNNIVALNGLYSAVALRASGGGAISSNFNDLWSTEADYDGVAPGANDLHVDPGFVNPARLDFHLSATSPLIDAGTVTSAPPEDFEGQARPNDVPGAGADGAGNGFDIGADEYYAPSPAPVIAPMSDAMAIEGSAFLGAPPLTSGTLPIHWSLVQGPPAMTIDPDTGIVSWLNPTAQGSPHSIVVRASNGFGTDDASWTLFVVPTFVPPRLDLVTDIGGGTAELAWTIACAGLVEYLGFAWDLYAGQWATPAGGSGIWAPYPPHPTTGTLALRYSGGYHVWISGLFPGGTWFPCLNPWTGIVYSGTPHMPLDARAVDLGGMNARLTWRPEVYGTWHYQIIAWSMAANDWVAVDGPSGHSLWQFVLYGNSRFTGGWVDLTLPAPGGYLFLIRGAGWLPPYDPPTAGDFASAYVVVAP